MQQTRMQVVNPSPAAIYTGIGNAIATISRAEGGLALWRGVSSVVVGAGARIRIPETSCCYARLYTYSSDAGLQDLHMQSTSLLTRW